CMALEQVVDADAGNQEASSDHQRVQHVREAPQERWVEDDVNPVGGLEPPVTKHESGWRLHPRVVVHDPERREECSDGDHHRGGEHGGSTDAAITVQKEADEARFNEERGDDLHPEERTLDRSGLRGENAPVEAQLERDHNPRNHTEPEANGEDTPPEAE